MNEDDILCGHALVDRLELLAFDARLTGTPEPLVQAVWEVLGAPEAAGQLYLATSPAHWMRYGVSYATEPPALRG